MLVSVRFLSSASKGSKVCAQRVAPGAASRQQAGLRNGRCVNYSRTYCSTPAAETAPEAELSANAREAFDKIKSLNFVELMSLGKELEKLTGISNEHLMAQMSSGAPAAQAAPADAAPVEAVAEAPKEITCADIKLIGFPEGNKFPLLKEIRKLKPGMNLMDSKKLVENLPQILQSRVSGDDLEEWKKCLDSVQAQYELIG